MNYLVLKKYFISFFLWNITSSLKPFGSFRSISEPDWGLFWALKCWRIAGQIQGFRDWSLLPSEKSENWSHKTCNKIKNIHLSKFSFSHVDAEFSYESIDINIWFLSKKWLKFLFTLDGSIGSNIYQRSFFIIEHFLN